MGVFPVEFHRNGQLKKVALAEDRTLGGRHFPEGSTVSFDEDGKIMAYIVKNKTLEGFPITVAEVILHKNGRIKGTLLLTEKEIEGIHFHANSWVEFNENGKLDRERSLPFPLPIQGEIGALYENHRPSAITLSGEQNIHGGNFPKDSTVMFGRDCHVEQIIFRATLNIKGISIRSDEIVVSVLSHKPPPPVEGMTDTIYNSSAHFYPNGQLFSAVLSKDQNIGGVNCAGKSRVYFHENGKLWAANLGSPQKIEGKDYGEFHWVQFDESGRPTNWSIHVERVLSKIK